MLGNIKLVMLTDSNLKSHDFVVPSEDSVYEVIANRLSGNRNIRTGYRKPLKRDTISDCRRKYCGIHAEGAWRSEAPVSMKWCRLKPGAKQEAAHSFIVTFDGNRYKNSQVPNRMETVMLTCNVLSEPQHILACGNRINTRAFVTSS